MMKVSSLSLSLSGLCRLQHRQHRQCRTERATLSQTSLRTPRQANIFKCSCHWIQVPGLSNTQQLQLCRLPIAHLRAHSTEPLKSIRLLLTESTVHGRSNCHCDMTQLEPLESRAPGRSCARIVLTGERRVGGDKLVHVNT